MNTVINDQKYDFYLTYIFLIASRDLRHVAAVFNWLSRAIKEITAFYFIIFQHIMLDIDGESRRLQITDPDSNIKLITTTTTKNELPFSSEFLEKHNI